MNIIRKEFNKSIQFLKKISQPQLKQATTDQQLFSVCQLLVRKLSYVKVKFNEELDRPSLIDTGAFANVLYCEFYKELTNNNFNSIT